jgi:hypothetical protein
LLLRLWQKKQRQTAVVRASTKQAQTETSNNVNMTMNNRSRGANFRPVSIPSRNSTDTPSGVPVGNIVEMPEREMRSYLELVNVGAWAVVAKLIWRVLVITNIHSKTKTAGTVHHDSWNHGNRPISSSAADSGKSPS